MLVVINKIRWCVAVCAVNYTVDRRNCWSHSSSHGTDSQTFVENRDVCLPHLHSTHPLGGTPPEYCHAAWYEKTRMVWLSDGEKISKICLFFLTEYTNVTDTHRQTPHDGIGRACIASRSKNRILFTFYQYLMPLLRVTDRKFIWM